MVGFLVFSAQCNLPVDGSEGCTAVADRETRLFPYKYVAADITTLPYNPI